MKKYRVKILYSKNMCGKNDFVKIAWNTSFSQIDRKSFNCKIGLLTESKILPATVSA